MKTGVYKILNVLNNKVYIGSAAYTFQKRWNGHLSKLRNNKHANSKLQAAWNKYGAESFKFEILLICDPEDCLFYEQIYLDFYKPEYNICLVAGNTRGLKATAERRKKISEANKGKIVSKETRERMKLARTGKRSSDDTKRKIGIASKKRNTGCGNPMFGKYGPNHPATKLTALDLLKIQELLLQGLSFRKIARLLDRPYSTVYKYICRFKISSKGV